MLFSPKNSPSRLFKMELLLKHMEVEENRFTVANSLSGLYPPQCRVPFA